MPAVLLGSRRHRRRNLAHMSPGPKEGTADRSVPARYRHADHLPGGSVLPARPPASVARPNSPTPNCSPWPSRKPCSASAPRLAGCASCRCTCPAPSPTCPASPATTNAAVAFGAVGRVRGDHVPEVVNEACRGEEASREQAGGLDLEERSRSGDSAAAGHIAALHVPLAAVVGAAGGLARAAQGHQAARNVGTR